MARGEEPVPEEDCWAYAEAAALDGVVCAVCLLGCWAREVGGFWRKEAKNVERKKGRWEGMFVLGAGIEMLPP